MNPWLIYSCEDCKELLKSMVEQKVQTHHLNELTRIVSNSKVNPLLQKLLEIIISHCRSNRDSTSETCVVEATAALEYASRNRDAGRLRLIRSACKNNRRALPALKYLKAWCDRAIAQQMWNEADMWFHMRVMCMDVYTLIHIFSCGRGTLCVFYGGDSHAQTLNRVLRKYKATLKATPADLLAMTAGRQLLSVNTYNLRGRTITIIGEDHWRTQSAFGKDLVTYLQDKCGSQLKITMLVEKHVSNNDDPVQTGLMCNMPNMAIHKFRCDTFLDTNKCSNLKIIPVDNRHYDLGFLRMEVFLLWNNSHMFRENAIEFHKSCVQSLIHLESTLRNQIS